MTLVLLQLGERNPKPDIEKEQVLIEGKRKVLLRHCSIGNNNKGEVEVANLNKVGAQCGWCIVKATLYNIILPP
jgi:hypothetical protein